MNLNFTISELCKSDIAIKNNINNMPDLKALDNLLDLIFYCLQPLRDKIARPIIISSGYRCDKVNRFVGGASNSQHLSGQAADFKVQGMTIAQTIDFIKNSGIEYDQLINEYDKWIHISYNRNKNRKQILKY
mgnify:CR=1 FL=1